MTLEQLKAMWRYEVTRPVAPPGRFESLRDDLDDVDRVLVWRDVWIVCLLAIGVWFQIAVGWFAQPIVDPATKVGAVLFALASAVVCMVLLGARRVDVADDWTLRARLQREIDKLERQQRVAQRVATWFLLPMVPAVALTTLGGQHSRTGNYVPESPLLLFYLFAIAVFALTWWLQRREARRHYGPLLTRLRRLHDELSQDN